LFTDRVGGVSYPAGALGGGDLFSEWVVVVAGDDVACCIGVYAGAAERVVCCVNRFGVAAGFDDR